MSYNKDEDYCSFSPEKLFGVKFNYACYLHDRQYRDEVKHRKTRKEADIDLKTRIFREFAKKGKPFFCFFGFIVSWAYYIGVRLFGGKYWDL